MITSAILNLLKSVISSLLSALPSSPNIITGSISDFVSFIAPFNSIFPIQEILNFFVFFVSVISVFLALWVVNKVINLIRGAG